MFNLIACVDENGALGYKNDLLFQYPEDMKLFKEATLGGIVIMGRNTWLSLPERFRPLPGRENIIISSTMEVIPSRFTVAQSIEEVIEIVKESDKNKWVIGGGKVYNDFLHQGLISEIHLSESKIVAEKADTFIDIEFIKNNYEETVSMDKGEFVYKIYNKKML